MGRRRLGGDVRVAPEVVVVATIIGQLLRYCHRTAWARRCHCTAWSPCCRTPEAHFHWAKIVGFSPYTVPLMTMLCPGEKLWLLVLPLLLLLLRSLRSPSWPPMILLLHNPCIAPPIHMR